MAKLLLFDGKASKVREFATVYHSVLGLLYFFIFLF